MLHQVGSLKLLPRFPQGQIQGNAAGIVGFGAGRAAHRRIDLLHRNFFLTAQNQQALHQIFQFADIARPAVITQPVLGSQGEMAVSQAFLVHKIADVVIQQFGHILNVIAQRRQLDWHHVELIVQIFAKAPGGDFLFQIAVSGGGDPDVDPDRFFATDSQERAALQGAGQLGLGFEVHVGQLIQKQGAATGLLQPAIVNPLALLGAEQFQAGVLAGDGTHPDIDERPGAARAVGVQEAGVDFLAGARFAKNQHRRIMLGDPQHLGAQSLQNFAAANRLDDHPLLAAQVLIFPRQPVSIQRSLHGQQHFSHGQRLLDEVVSAQPGRFHRSFHRAVPGHHDNRTGQMIALAPFLEQADAVGVRHPDIQQDQIGTLDAAGLASRSGVFRNRDHIAFIFQNVPDQVADIRFIINDQNIRRAHPASLAGFNSVAGTAGGVDESAASRWIGSRIAIRAPPSGAFST